MTIDTTTLHVRCGTDIAETLRSASIDGAFFEYSDPYCRGPVLRDPVERLEARVEYIATRWHQDRAHTRAKLEGFRALHAQMERAERVLLWFEHDLYDQPILWELLAGLSDRPDLRERCELISTDRVAGVERFRGFGQLSPTQLRDQLQLARPVVDDDVADARRYWDAFCSPDPASLNTLLPSDALPYAKGAVERHLAEFPDPVDGLSLTQRLALRAVHDGAPNVGKAFGRVTTELDPLPFLGSLMFFADLEPLRDAAQPALTQWTEFSDDVSLTEFGAALVRGEVNWIEANGIDEWRGGVHLVG